MPGANARRYDRRQVLRAILFDFNGVLVDDDTWQVGAYDAPSIWGHKPPATGPLVPAILRPAS